MTGGRGGPADPGAGRLTSMHEQQPGQLTTDGVPYPRGSSAARFTPPYSVPAESLPRLMEFSAPGSWQRTHRRIPRSGTRSGRLPALLGPWEPRLDRQCPASADERHLSPQHRGSQTRPVAAELRANASTWRALTPLCRRALCLLALALTLVRSMGACPNLTMPTSWHSPANCSNCLSSALVGLEEVADVRWSGISLAQR